MADSAHPVERDFFLAVSRLLAGAGLIGGSLWLSDSVFVPLAREFSVLEYILVSATFARLIAWTGAALVALLVIQWLIVRRQGGEPTVAVFTPTSTRHLTVLWWLALSWLPLLNLGSGVAGRIAPWSYVLYDLRWWWWPIVIAAMLRRAWPGLSFKRAWSRAGTVHVAGTLVFVVLGFAVLSSGGWNPVIRLHGDEPKYVRFCENFYQGLGFDIAAKQPLAAAQPHVLRNFAGLARALAEEVPLLADDARRLVGLKHSAHLKSAQRASELFFEGKHRGSVYQVHTPGLSFLLFPAYYLDRRITGAGSGYQDEFPESLPAVTATLFGLFAAFSLAIYALVRAQGQSLEHAFLVSLITGLTLPAGAFALQIYPEIPAGIIVALLARRLLQESPSSRAVDLGWGFLAGLLPWLHVRFALVAAVAICWHAFGGTARLRAALPFAFAAIFGLGAFALYTYRLTGSFLPGATYGDTVPLSFERVSHGIPAFFFDRTFGVLAHSPIYLLAFCGYIILWRQRRRAAVFVTVMLGAIIIPAAGHGYWAGGATPGRYLVAAIPLFAIALAESFASQFHRRLFVAALGSFALVSLETAARYNFFFRKDVGSIIAPGVAGWRMNLVFPSLGYWWSLDRTAIGLLVIWVAISVVLAALLLRPAAKPATHDAINRAVLVPTIAGLLLLAGLSWPIGWITRQTVAPNYLLRFADARARVLVAYADLRQCALCYASLAGAVNPTSIVGNQPALVDLQIPSSLTIGQRAHLRIRPRTTTGDYLLGNLMIDFGDGTSEMHRRYFGDLETVHVFQRAGTYRVRAGAVWDAAQAWAEAEVAVQ